MYALVEPMPTVKNTRAVVRAHNWSTLASGLILALGAWYFLIDPISRWWVIAILMPLGVFALVLQERRCCRFQCPQCNQILHRKRTFDRSPMTFKCDRCDVIWDIGVREPLPD
jgi:hypothetical protein